MSEIELSVDVGKLGRVAVLFGGQSAEREVSLQSGQAVIDALIKAGVDVVGIDADDALIERLAEAKPALVFIALHGAAGEDGRVQALLEFLKYPYTGSGVQASAIAMDKWRSKQIFSAAGIPSPAYRMMTLDTDLSDVVAELGCELMVKPASEGSSIGMSKVHSEDELKQALAKALAFDPHVFAEQVISGAEYTVAVLDGEALPVIKLETDREFYDFEAKYVLDDTRYLCPCGLAEEAEQELQALALKTFEALGCEGWGRVDFMADAEGCFYVLEVNTVPGMTSHSLVPMAAKAQGLSFEDLVVSVAKTAIAQ